ncbi:TPA: hypothetical protein JLT01_004266 [Escherichia coli]|nr:hypothetical protein [Escherichia coli]
MLCTCSHCKKQFEAQRRTAKFCSPACKMASQRKGTQRVRLTTKQKLQGSTFLQFLVTHVKRSGSLAVLPAPNNQQGWNELYSLHAKAQMFNYALPEGQSVHVSHYYPASSGGKLVARNLGLWPAALNQSFSTQSMPFGSRVNPESRSRYACTEWPAAKIRTAIIKHCGDSITNVTKALPLTPVTKAIKRLMTLTGKSFDSLFSMKRSDLDALFQKHDIDPHLDATLNRFTSDELREILMTETNRPATDFTDMTKQELLTLLKRYNVTKDMVKPSVFQKTLSDVFRDECFHQLHTYEAKPATDEKGKQAITDLRTFADMAKRVPENARLDPWLECGNFAVTGRADMAIQKLNRLLSSRDIGLTPDSYSPDVDPNAALELDDGTVIFESIKGRTSNELTTDQLYSWYVTTPHYNRKKSVTTAIIRNLYDKVKNNALPTAA